MVLLSAPVVEPVTDPTSSLRHACGAGVVSSPSTAQSSDASPTYMRVVLPPRSTRSNSVRSPNVSPCRVGSGLLKSFWFIVWKTWRQVGLLPPDWSARHTP